MATKPCLVRIYPGGFLGAGKKELYVVSGTDGRVLDVIATPPEDSGPVSAAGYDPHDAVELEVTKATYKRYLAHAKKSNPHQGSKARRIAGVTVTVERAPKKAGANFWALMDGDPHPDWMFTPLTGPTESEVWQRARETLPAARSKAKKNPHLYGLSAAQEAVYMHLANLDVSPTVGLQQARAMSDREAVAFMAKVDRLMGTARTRTAAKGKAKKKAPRAKSKRDSSAILRRAMKGT